MARDLYFNLFLIASLEEGLGPDCEVWVQDGIGMIQRYRRGWIVDPGSRPDLFDFDAAATVIDGYAPACVRTVKGDVDG